MNDDIQKYEITKLLTNEIVTSLVFVFDDSERTGCIVDPHTGAAIIRLPKQCLDVEGYKIHQESYFSEEFSSYLRYLDTHHIILQSEALQIAEIYDTGEPSPIETEDADAEEVFEYFVKTIRIPAEVNYSLYNDLFIGFSFLNNQLYSSISIDVVEQNHPPIETGANTL
jgi:hypothetical protein